MAPRAHLSRTDYESYEDYGEEAFVSGDRLCAPRKGSGGSTLLSAALVIAIGLGGAWAAKSYPAAWQAAVSAASSLVEPGRPAPAEGAPPPAPVAVASPEPAAILPETRAVGGAPGAEAGEAVLPPPPVDASEATVEAETVDGEPAPLPKPAADPADPNQKRALAAGLHPDLSRSLLARLTAADYRNASKAIKTALAETPDAGVYTWPREPTAKLAQFAVHFVKGAGPECRRYVVTVTKDRWSTTAPAMETCGADVSKRKSVIKAAG
jgi:hypothetical protein